MFGKWLCVLYVYIIFLRVFRILLVSVSWLESKGNVYTTVNTMLFGKEFYFFFIKKKVKLTLTMLLNVCVSLLLLKINEPVR